MSVHPIRTARITSPEQLIDALRIPFSREQLDAITAPLEPAVIIAGAGSGKTTVMAARVVWLVGTGQVRPEEVLGLTFTRKAAAELASRVASALDRAGVLTGQEGEGAELVMTYDSFAARLVSEFGIRIGIDRDPVMVTGASRFRLATRVVANAPGPFHSISRLSHHTIPERVLALDAELQSHLVSAVAVEKECDRTEQKFAQAPLYRGATMRDVARALDATAERRELLQLVERYQELKRALGVVEFADQLREAVRLVTQVPAVGEELRARFRVVLLDEYQDTSAAQARLLRELFTGSPYSDAMGFPVTAVGDPYQAIYGWRGAASGNILEFPHQFRRTDGTPATRHTLSINRRSGQRILDVGNALARGLAAAPGEDGVSLVAAEGAPRGMVAAATFDTFRDEVDWIAESVVARHETGTGWAEQAILVRRNALLAPLFEALRERDVPVEIVGLGGLLGLPEVAPVVSTLRVIDDVTANPDVATLLAGPRWQLGLADLELLGERARQLGASSRAPEVLDDALVHAVTQADPGEVVCLLDAVADPGEDLPFSAAARRRLALFHREITGLRRHASDPVAELVTRVVSTLGLEAELLAAGADTGQIARFVAEVSGYTDVDGDGTLTGLLAYLDAEEDFGEGLQQAVPTEADSVKLLTVHRAKGLEWDTVFLPGLVDKVFPSEPRSGIWPSRAETLPATLRGDAAGVPQLQHYTKDGLAAYREATKVDHRLSEDRLAYVAATRAKHLLVASSHVWTPGNIRPRLESPYFTVLREEAASAGCYLDEARRGTDTNPVPAEPLRASWPASMNAEVVAQRRAAASLVGRAAGIGADPATRLSWVWESGTLSAEDEARVAAWDDTARHLTALLQRRGDYDVEVPEGLSTTALMALRTDPSGFAGSLARRMPRPPSRAARVGDAFHTWLQRRFELPATLDEVDAAAAAEPGAVSRLIEAFEAGQFAHLVPLGVEVPFVMARGRHVLRGRIDAVYQWPRDGVEYLVVDWKTSQRHADPLQLAVYRQAWAEARRIDPSRVGAAFYHVLADQLRVVDAPVALIDAALDAGKEPR